MAKTYVGVTYYPAGSEMPLTPRAIEPELWVARMSLPVSIRCKNCGEETYRGTRFTLEVEDVQAATDRTREVWRFHLICPKDNCWNEIKIKTDPENLGYIVESGADRIVA